MGLFVCCLDFFVTLENFFYSFWVITVILPVKGYKIIPLLDTRRHWAVRIFLRCHTYCDTGQPFKMVISELTPVAECFAVFAVLSLPVLITTYVCPERGSNRDLPRAKQTLYHWTNASDGTKSNKQTWFLQKQWLPSAKRKNLISGTQ